jgi:integrase
VAWIEGRRAKDGTVTWFVYWREAGRNSAKKSVKAGTRRRDAERLAVEIQARVNSGLVGSGVVAKRATFGEFADKWLAMRIVRPTTLRRDRGLINTYLRPAFASTLLSAITVEDVRALLAKVTEEQSPSTARRLLAVLGKMFVDAVRSDYARRSPIEKLDRRDKPQSRKIARAIDVEELLTLLKSSPERWATFSLVAVLTGLRWGEITSLEWPDIDFEAGKIHVLRATPAGTKGAQDPKSLTSHRSIDILWPVREALLDLPQRDRLVFPRARRGFLNHGWFHRRIWLPVAQAVQATRAWGSRLRFHDLRHGFASLLLAWGEPILYVSQQLGHSSAAFTLSTYAHLIQQGRKLDKEDTLQKLFGAAKCDRAPRVPQEEVVREVGGSETLANPGAGDGIRTRDLRITSAPLYH